MAKKFHGPGPRPENGTALRGPQLAPTEAQDVTGRAAPDDILPGGSLAPPESTTVQLRALERVVSQLKAAIADATIAIEEMTEHRAQMVAKARGSNERYVAAVRAAAAGLGIDASDTEKAWTYDPASGSFTRTR